MFSTTIIIAAALTAHSGSAAHQPDTSLPVMPDPQGLPWRWPQARFLIIDVAIDPALTSEWLPEGLTLTDPAVATYYIAHYPDSQCCDEYYEAGIFIEVLHQGQTKWHCPWMVVDSDTAMTKGRDLLGFPKKIADISLTFNLADSTVHGTVARKGALLLDWSGSFGDVVQDPPPILGRPFINVWGAKPYQSAEGRVSEPRLLDVAFSEAVIQARTADLSIIIDGTPTDPLDEILPGPVLNARVHLTNVGLPGDPTPFAYTTVSDAWWDRMFLIRFE